MIGLKFLMTFFSVAVVVILLAVALFTLWFVVSWVIRLLITGFGVTAKDHYEWVKEHAPRRKSNKFCKDCYKIYSMDTMDLLIETDDPKVVQMCMRASDLYIVVEPGKELKNV